MSEEQLKAFLEKVKDDTALREQIKSVSDVDAVLAIAKETGFRLLQTIFSRWNLLQSYQKMSLKKPAGAVGLSISVRRKWTHAKWAARITQSSESPPQKCYSKLPYNIHSVQFKIRLSIKTLWSNWWGFFLFTPMAQCVSLEYQLLWSLQHRECISFFGCCLTVKSQSILRQATWVFHWGRSRESQTYTH